MEKVLISLTEPQIEWLDEEAAYLGISRSELVRRIIDKEREKSGKLRARFWDKVDTSDGPEACWLWIGARHRQGYGEFLFSSNGRWGPRDKRRAHRVAYEFTYGPIPKDLDIMHTCDIPACVNPAHLRAVTTAENMQDMVKKGRHWTQRADYTFDSEKTPSAKLNWEKVRDIRKRYAEGSALQQELAEEYGVCHPHISAIIHGTHWPE